MTTASLEAFGPAIEATLEAQLPRTSGLTPRLIDAMRYAVLGAGKRIRPLLTCATATTLGAPLERVLMPACAAEYVHAYSLIHDDLPCMDDDDLRRGRPSCHRAFDEATAVLAGDALQALAFQCLHTSPGLDAETRLAMAETLARAAGHDGMVGGQALDMALTGGLQDGGTVDLDALKTMHAAKTGALISASVRIGAMVAGVRDEPNLEAFGRCVGLAFQVIDDLLDVTATTEALGKAAGADAALGKVTFPGLVGVAETRNIARSLHDEAVAALAECGIRSGPLIEIADLIVTRDR